MIRLADKICIAEIIGNCDFTCKKCLYKDNSNHFKELYEKVKKEN